jgi:uncharacterized C2H2 Zn-finger protein
MISMVKFLECPNCGFVFKAPVMDLKFTHLGWTIPGAGVVRCPQCKEEKRRKHYKLAQETDLSKNPASDSGVTAKAKPATESELVEESKYEDE